MAFLIIRANNVQIRLKSREAFEAKSLLLLGANQLTSCVFPPKIDLVSRLDEAQLMDKIDYNDQKSLQDSGAVKFSHKFLQTNKCHDSDKAQNLSFKSHPVL